MAQMTDKDYITVKREQNGKIGIFVGGKPATMYRGEGIYDIEYVKRIFAWMQERDSEIEEFHIGAFATLGEYAKTGNPGAKFGPNAWCRIKKKNSSRAPWVFASASSSAANCASNCARYCAVNVRGSASFRSAVLGFAAIDKVNAKNDNAQPVSKKSKAPNKPLIINLPWHIITIEKRSKTM